MNHFEVFGLPVMLAVDKTELTRRYQELAGNESAGHLRSGHSSNSSHAVQKSAIISTAYKTLLNQDETLRYVLQMKGLIHEEEKYEPDPEFLMEINAISQELSVLSEADQEKIESIETEVKEKLKQVYAALEPHIENFDEDSVTEKELLQVKEYYYRKKFLQRLLDKVAQLRNIAAL